MSNVSYKLLHKLSLQEEGPSATLQNLLTTIFETTSLDGCPRHSDLAQQNLIKAIAGHSYAKIFFPLCHFLAIGARHDIPLYQWFATPKPMTAVHLSSILRPAVSEEASYSNSRMKDQFLIETLIGNYKFDVNLTHIAKHSALLDFIMEVIGYDGLEIVYDKLKVLQNRHEISVVSNDLSREIYQFLKIHFPTSATQKKAKSMRDFLGKCRGLDKSVSLTDIDDDLIVEFWINFSLVAKSKFRLYANCAYSWATFRQAIRAVSSNEFHYGVSIDTANEQGLAEITRVDQKAARATLGQFVDEMDLGERLQFIQPAKLKTIKLINTKEYDQIAKIIAFGDEGPALALTVLRLLTFGPVQARLVETSRKKGLARPESVQSLVDDAAYEENLEQIKTLGHTTQGLARAAAFSLYLAKSSAFFHAATKLADASEQGAMRSVGKEIRASLTRPVDENVLVEKITTKLIENTPKIMPQLFDQLQRSKIKFRRKGLGKLPLENIAAWTIELSDGFDILLALEAALNRLVKVYHKMVEPRADHTTLQCQLMDDRNIFFDQFKQIYGLRS